MEIVSICLLLVALGLLASGAGLLFFDKEKTNQSVGGGIVMMFVSAILLIGVIFIDVPDQLGRARFPKYVEPISDRLDSGKVYELSSASIAGNSQLLIVHEQKSNIYWALRVCAKCVPPSTFTLIDGKAAFIPASPPVPASAPK